MFSIYIQIFYHNVWLNAHVESIYTLTSFKKIVIPHDLNGVFCLHIYEDALGWAGFMAQQVKQTLTDNFPWKSLLYSVPNPASF